MCEKLCIFYSEMAVGAWLIWFGFCDGSMAAQVLNNRIFT